MPPDLLAHYFYLSETTMVRQAIETAPISVYKADFRRVTGAGRLTLFRNDQRLLAVDVGEHRDQRRLDFTREPTQCFGPGCRVMQHISALAGLATKPLPKKLRHVGLVVDDENADAHDVSLCRLIVSAAGGS